MIINILGNTTWGITLAKVLSNGNNQVNLIYRDKEKLSKVEADKYITVKEFKIPKSTKINHINVEDCNFSDKDLLIISVPSPSLEKNLSLIKNKINHNTQIISASKGFDKNGNTLSVLMKMERILLRVALFQLQLLFRL